MIDLIIRLIKKKSVIFISTTLVTLINSYIIITKSILFLRALLLQRPSNKGSKIILLTIKILR